MFPTSALDPRTQMMHLRMPAESSQCATTCPFDNFADGLLLGRGNAACRCQEIVARLAESREHDLHPSHLENS